jgi:hypothetical protein
MGMGMTTQQADLMTIAAYARHCGVSASAISRQVASGKIPAVQSGGRKMIDPRAADSARRTNPNRLTGHGGRPDRSLRRAAAWEARRNSGYVPAQAALLSVMRAAWPELMRKAMAVLDADELNQARAVLALREMVECLACVVHDDIGSGVPDFRKPLAEIPKMRWSEDALQDWFDHHGDDGRWASDEGGLTGGSELADEMLDVSKPARSSDN